MPAVSNCKYVCAANTKSGKRIFRHTLSRWKQLMVLYQSLCLCCHSTLSLLSSQTNPPPPTYWSVMAALISALVFWMQWWIHERCACSAWCEGEMGRRRSDSTEAPPRGCAQTENTELHPEQQIPGPRAAGQLTWTCFSQSFERFPGLFQPMVETTIPLVSCVANMCIGVTESGGQKGAPSIKNTGFVERARIHLQSCMVLDNSIVYSHRQFWDVLGLTNFCQCWENALQRANTRNVENGAQAEACTIVFSLSSLEGDLAFLGRARRSQDGLMESRLRRRRWCAGPLPPVMWWWSCDGRR